MLQDLQAKMVFLGGPRQVGKTTLAQSIFKKKISYLNWDIPKHREIILTKEWPLVNEIIFDEIHKYSDWRNLLKGFFDEFKKEKQILVTGSAKLDYYRRGGDSLQGRYHYWRLHPLSVAELGLKKQQDFLTLLKLGGFPEPYLAQSDRGAKRFSREYRTRLIYEDVTTLERVFDLGKIESLALRLPQLCGSLLSINSITEDLQVSHRAISNWIAIFERLYFIFRIPPYTSKAIRGLKKDQKHYHFDWSLIKKDAIRFENLVACHLLKYVHYKQDSEAQEIELKFFRDFDKREVDFIITDDNVPIMAVECKWSDREVSPALRYFKKKFPEVKAWQISATGKKNYVSKENIRVAPALDFLKELA